MAVATEYFSNRRPVRRASPALVPRLLSGAAILGGGFAVGLWALATLGGLQSLGRSPLPEAPVSRLDSLRSAQVFSRPGATRQQPFSHDRASILAAAKAIMTPEQWQLAQASGPIRKPLDAGGRAILQQALAASVADRAMADEGARLAATNAALAASQQVASLLMQDVAPLGPLAETVPAALQTAEAGIDPIVTGPRTASTEAGALQLAMLPDTGPSPVARPRIDPFERVMAEEDRLPALDTPARAAAPKTIPLKSAPERTAPKTLMAYARPDDVMDDDDSPSIFRQRASLPGRGSGIAVYDISKATVHMPNGEKLTAHSGRGEYRDNPRSIHIKNRGATPPNIYRLTMREALFHGVEALRMTPVGGNSMYGRDGFLTHTFLLRVRGDSSGCVVFEQYPRFLAAFKRGEIKTLIVVPSVNELPKYLAKL